MSRYIIIVDSETAETTAAITGYLKGKNLLWWHWFPNSWLVVNKGSLLSSLTIVTDLKSLMPTVYSFASEIKNDTWTGFGPGSTEKDGKNMFTWLETNWQNK